MSKFEITPFEGVGPATEADVASFESEIGYRLPPDYRKFLLTLNGGHTSQTAIVVENHPYPYGYEASIRDFYSLSDSAPSYSNLYESLRSKYFKLPDGHVAVADSHGNLVTIDCSAPNGPVYYFDHEMPDENDLDDDDVCQYKTKHAILLTANFDELLSKLANYVPTENGG